MLLALLILITKSSFSTGACPNWCNRHGTCSAPSLGEEQHCICNVGYTGEDCNSKICPKAFDYIANPNPSKFRTIGLKTSLAGGKMSGTLEFKFGLSQISINANANELDGESCRDRLNQLGGIDEVGVQRSLLDESTGTATYIISFLRFTQVAFENNIFNHNGNPPLSSFYCNTTNVDKTVAVSPFCEIFDVESKNVPCKLKFVILAFCFFYRPV